MHKSSMDKMLAFKKKYLDSKKNEALLILDIGSLDINGSYRGYFDIFPWIYQGIDMTPGKNVDIVLKNSYKWREIKSNSVDVLISGQAFEHIEFFWISVLEIFRVLKPGSLFCLIAPSGGHEHRYPVDCWRFYPDGFFALAKFAQLDVLEVKTQWKSQGYTDGSDDWRDSMIVCRKPEFALWPAIKSKAKNRLQYHALAIGLR